ncbi:universal stress protein [Halostella sp. JP-L12]|uniref:universal stress protein n=1 Tax=Halostella TaxID=1843185 RepID=UPI000EF83F1D|nr:MULTISPECIES: universal stress protein [Halostella]NHN46198.1 universal stress protein [Halostella sp. JP-L12]
MTLLVPFDGSDLAEGALLRAREFSAAFAEDVVAVTVIPDGNADYARERGWIEPDEPFDAEAIVSRLQEQVHGLCASAEHRHETVDRYAPTGTIASRVRAVAREENASMVFVGSENAGRLVVGITSVGGTIASNEAYDVVIVRQRSPP